MFGIDTNLQLDVMLGVCDKISCQKNPHKILIQGNYICSSQNLRNRPQKTLEILQTTLFVLVKTLQVPFMSFIATIIHLVPLEVFCKKTSQFDCK